MQTLIEGVAQLPGALTVPECRLSEPRDPRFSPYVLALAFPPVPGEVLVRSLAERSIYVSSGSACSSRSREKRERVLRGMGVPGEISASTLRVSLGWETGETEIARLLAALEEIVPDLRRVAGLTRPSRAPASGRE